MRRPVTTIAVGVAFVALGVLAACPASAERLEVLRDGRSGRVFAIRVAPADGAAPPATGPPTADELLVTADRFLVVCQKSIDRNWYGFGHLPYGAPLPFVPQRL